MTTPTYNVSTPGKRWCNQEVVGEFSYENNLQKLATALGATEREEAFFTAELTPEPDNPHSPSGQAISVRWNNLTIGYLPENDAARYQQLRRIVASGYTPVTSARLWYHTGVESDRNYYLQLSLREPDLLTPLNDPPSEGWTLLPPGSTVQVTKEADHSDVLLDYVPPSGVGQLLVTLHLISAGVRTKYEAVEVRLDGERIGELTKQTSGKYAVAIRHFNEIGLTVASLATIKGSSLSAEVVLHSAKANELSEEDLEPEVSPLPRLVPFCEDVLEYDVPNAYTAEPTQQQERKRRPPLEEAEAELDESEEDLAAWGENYEDPAEKKQGNQSPHPAMPTMPPVPSVYSRQGESPHSEGRAQHSRIDIRDLYSDGKISGAALLDAAQKVPNKSGILLWVCVVFAGMCVLAGLGVFGVSIVAGFGYIITGLGIGLACGWPLYCRSQDKKALAQWGQDQVRNRELSQYLSEDERSLLSGFDRMPPPARVQRNWKVVAPIAAVLIVAGFSMTAAVLPELDSSVSTGITSP